jgi:hypothetical protein
MHGQPALMVKGTLEGAAIARRMAIDALFLDRGQGGLRQTATGLFALPRRKKVLDET